VKHKKTPPLHMKDLRYALSFLSVAAITAVPGAALALPQTPTPRLACYTQLKDGRIIDLSALCSTKTLPSRVPATLEQAAIEAERERARIQAELLSKQRGTDPVSQLLQSVPTLWR
jgi:hypothetical protein